MSVRAFRGALQLWAPRVDVLTRGGVPCRGALSIEAALKSCSLLPTRSRRGEGAAVVGKPSLAGTSPPAWNPVARPPGEIPFEAPSEVPVAGSCLGVSARLFAAAAHGAVGVISVISRGPAAGIWEQRRFVARVKVHRFAGVVPLKIRSPKSDWYLQAEKEFLSEREQVPEGYIERWREEDLCKLDPPLRAALSLRCASNAQLHKWRKLQLCRQLQRRPFDTGSSAVQIACLTENILNARQHLLKHRRDHSKKRILSIWLARRHRAMKYLYRTDYDLYKLTCQILRIKCVHFAIPDSRDRQRAISPVAVDGDRCKFLIRQRLWKGRYRPRPVKQGDGKTVRYTRHVMEQPPPGWNLPHETKPRVSRAWPYGVREERLKGEYIIPNPTAAGIGYCPVPLFF
ncbi:uncharacterized protein LOC34618639 [Cyclospora cayetanensis]|uniref:Uncharacterized protein LOC34618639 n=1 Tax=Cyclospora cayetanensis TaxID=88456 RepID=A0A6P6S047_9EIME|nr:uncharacterized protein LOC34618639 [Cyclospora cayetanensis]